MEIIEIIDSMMIVETISMLKLQWHCVAQAAVGSNVTLSTVVSIEQNIKSPFNNRINWGCVCRALLIQLIAR